LEARGVVINNRADTNHMESLLFRIMEAVQHIQVLQLRGTLGLQWAAIKEAVVDTQVAGAATPLAGMQQRVTKQLVIREVVINNQLTKVEVVGNDINHIRES